MKHAKVQDHKVSNKFLKLKYLHQLQITISRDYQEKDKRFSTRKLELCPGKLNFEFLPSQRK